MKSIPVLLLSICVLGMTGCGSGYRTANITARSVTANTYTKHQQVNDNPVTSQPAEICRVDWTAAGGGSVEFLNFVEPALSLTGPDGESFNAGLIEIKSIRGDTPALERASILVKAKERFSQASALTSDADVRDAANLNLAVTQAALGDWNAYRNTIAKLPTRESYPRNINPFVNLLLIPIHIVGYIVTLGNYGQADPLDAPVNSARGVMAYMPREPGIRQDVATNNQEVTKVSAAAVAPTFHYADATTQTRQFADLDVSIDYDVDDIGITDLRVIFTNKSQRVVNIGNMAARIVQQGTIKKTNDIKIVEAEARALPQEKAVVHFSLDGKANWQKIFATEKAGEYALTIYDIPVAFDALGAVAKKDNITWNFTFTPGSREQRVRDDEKSVRTITWWTFTPGYQLVK